MSLSVGQVAQLAGTSVRTLHHYDAVGLLQPSGRSPAGYRQYTDGDIERLSRILFYRELGFPLRDIAELLADPARGPREHMERQRDLIRGRIDRMEAMVAAIDKELEAHTMDYTLTPAERLEIWGDFVPEEHEAEAEERWGGTDAWAESARRTKRYTAEDWREIKADAQRAADLMIQAMASGEPPTSTRAMDAAEAHRAHITRWFYDCSTQMHRGLADMWVGDPRFTRTYEAQAAGLADYTARAARANADRQDATE